MERDERPSILETSVSQYELDFYGWTLAQTDILKAGQFDKLDLENLIEEIETLGRSELSELRSRYKVLALHLLKRLAQPEKDGTSWTVTIIDQRVSIAQLLKDNPGLKPKRETLFQEAYVQSRKVANAETQIPLARFPEHPPFTVDEAEDETYLSEATNRGGQ